MPWPPKFSLSKLHIPEIDVAHLEGTRLHRPIAVIVIALSAAIASILLSVLPITRDGVALADHVFYDWFYRHRPKDTANVQDIVLVAIDNESITDVDNGLGWGWPWGRLSYHMMTKFAEENGAKAIVFDISLGARSSLGVEDDEGFALRMDETKIPVVFARLQRSDGDWEQFKPNIRRPIEFGTVNALSSEKVWRDYLPVKQTQPSIAIATLNALNLKPKLPTDRPFLLHYYGPHRDAQKQPTFRSIRASQVIEAVNFPDIDPPKVTRKDFENKIVIVGATGSALDDLKAVPNAPLMPGCEIHATAIANLLHGQSVQVMPHFLTTVLAIVAGLIVAASTVLLRNALLKFLSLVILLTIVIGGRYLLFTAFDAIYWSAISVPLMTILFAAIGGICWSYFLEDRQARRLLKALETCLSPSVAAQLAKDPRQLASGGRQLDMTVMFTDLAGFTEHTERLKENIEKPLNYYLSEMSEQLIIENGTLDKYIGDAILTFWNAPIDQPQHAKYACRAALRIQRREREIRGKMAELGIDGTTTRIGINTGQIVVGFMGSERKLNYTVIGDPVNIAARLEPANKLYGTQIMVAEPTVSRVRDLFLFRRIDLLQVKGKSEPMGVYELMGDESMKNTEHATLARRFEEAFDLYRKQNWDAAQRILLELLEKFPEDGPCKTFLKRIAEFRESPPPADWDGVYVAKTK